MKPNYLIATLLLAQGTSALPRNPFQQPILPCVSLLRQLQQWTLHGVISSEKSVVALMRDPKNNWHRMMKGMPVEPDVLITDLTPPFLSVALPSACGQPFYSWEIKGNNYGMDALNRSADRVAAGRPGR
jgi:hypothetical protein